MPGQLAFERLRASTTVPIVGLALCLATMALAPISPAFASANDQKNSADVAADTSGTDDTVVVTASRTKQKLNEVPSAISVIKAEQIDLQPADNYGDMLRNTVGVNVAQTSARDVWVNTRNSAGTIVQGLLVLVDNRNIFQDFNGFVVWDGIPLDPYEIKQIEAVRGPGSALWGSNATDGVINIITKPPKEMIGTSVMLGGGERQSFDARVSHAGVRGKFGYKVSGVWYQQEAYARPTGIIPGSDGPGNPGGTPYPEYNNADAKRPSLDVRLDYYQNDTTTWSISGGYLEFDGMFLSPGGPFEFGNKSYDAYVKADWARGATRATFYGNFNALDGFFSLSNFAIEGDNQAYNLDVVDSRSWGSRQFLTYGGNVRYDAYNSGLTPEASSRDRYALFVQDEIFLTDQIRFVGGVRWDHIDPMGSAFSPRTALLFSPVQEHTFRASWNRAFQAPTMLENYAEIPNANIITVPTQQGPLTLVFPLVSLGNTDLKEEQVDAIEVGWTGNVVGRIRGAVSLYRNELKNSIRYGVAETYSSSNIPPGWPLDPALLDVPPPMGFAGIPSVRRSTNLGKIINQGIEFGVDVQATRELSFFGNYSWQDTPEVSDIDPQRMPDGSMRVGLNEAPRHRFNVGADWQWQQFYANGHVNYQDAAFWADVLTPNFWGPTESFAMLNLAGGVRLMKNRVTLSVHALNVTDERAQQHVWGDLIGRKVTGRAVYRF